MTEMNDLRALIEEVLAAPPYDEIYCSFCGVPMHIDHRDDCWIVRARAALDEKEARFPGVRYLEDDFIERAKDIQ